MYIYRLISTHQVYSARLESRDLYHMKTREKEREREREDDT